MGNLHKQILHRHPINQITTALIGNLTSYLNLNGCQNIYMLFFIDNSSTYWSKQKIAL